MARMPREPMAGYGSWRDHQVVAELHVVEISWPIIQLDGDRCAHIAKANHVVPLLP